ncbi:hypothetical protein CYLTODRAFT_461817, partial [Cylindrobasidium torrendii FP15055 ss-10]
VNDIGSEDEDEEQSRPTTPVESDESDQEDDSGATVRPAKRPRFRNTDFESTWYPWDDRVLCTIDILMHLPRSVFSKRQLEIFLWILSVNQVDFVPTVSTTNRLVQRLQQVCGIESI